MSHPSASYSEDALIEQPAIALLAELGWQTANCFSESFGIGGTLGREDTTEVVLASRLRPALERLNPGLPSGAISLAIHELTKDRGVMSPVEANREVYRLLKDGLRVVTRPEGENAEQIVEVVRLIDWDEPTNNDFFLASQLWVSGEMYRRRADLVGFVNGIPLLFVELKASHKALKTAFDGNLRDYRDAIPQLFWFNGLIVLSNGSESRVGSISATWEHFKEWKHINNEGEQGVISLETMLRGVCEPTRLLDLVESFTVFDELRGAPTKLLGMNHQYLGVNSAIAALARAREDHGRLGVFWHTQGSGKSVSMVFFAQKILRKVPGNWTFLIVTDRKELDDQIYQQFAHVGAVTETEAHAATGEELRRLLRENHRYVFTLIQKFRTEPGVPHPVLSDRADIVVIADEAHRSQYDTFALNMRSALPNASFIGFTGTPLMAGEERTRDVFGDYVSIYSYRQSTDDGATVPLFYENRIPELQLTNADLNEEMEALLEDAELDEEQETRLEHEFARQYHLITREERLDTIAKDLVAHFIGRGYQGKAMVVSIDKATTVRMYDLAQRHWRERLDALRAELGAASAEERPAREAQLAYLDGVDMAVVVSQGQNEIAEMKAKGLDIAPHRLRMVKEDLATKFKDPDDPFSIVFVCAMWMTGFDAPACSTIYLDKPMRNHTLMQTIARANRVWKDKVNGLIVDYVGIFNDLRKALAIYTPGGDGGAGDPVLSKAELVAWLQRALDEATRFCVERGVDLDAIPRATAFERVKLIDDAVEAIIVNDDSRRDYLLLAASVARLYRAILPDPLAAGFAPFCTLLAVLAAKISSLTPEVDISAVMGAVEDLLDRSIATQGYLIRDPSLSGAYDQPLVDLRAIDFTALQAKFASARKRSEAARLRALIGQTLARMVQLNRSRLDYLERFQRMIDEYNAGSANIEEFFQQLLDFAKELNEEDQRGMREQLTDEELALFDLLTKPDLHLSRAQQDQVKRVARELLAALKNGKLVLEWRKKQQARALVRQCILDTFEDLPSRYSGNLFDQKVDLTYQHIYESYYGDGRSIYSAVA